MKSIFLSRNRPLCLLFLLFLLPACSATRFSSSPQPPKLVVAPSREDGQSIPFLSKILRVDASKHRGEPLLTVCENAADWSRFAKQSGVPFAEGTGGYDDAFFEQSLLVLITVQEANSSIRHTVESVGWLRGGVRIEILRNLPESGAQELAVWQIVVELPRSVVAGADSFSCSFSPAFGTPGFAV